jgi:hypothetical protein
MTYGLEIREMKKGKDLSKRLRELRGDDKPEDWLVFHRVYGWVKRRV